MPSHYPDYSSRFDEMLSNYQQLGKSARFEDWEDEDLDSMLDEEEDEEDWMERLRQEYSNYFSNKRPSVPWD